MSTSDNRKDLCSFEDDYLKIFENMSARLWGRSCSLGHSIPLTIDKRLIHVGSPVCVKNSEKMAELIVSRVERYSKLNIPCLHAGTERVCTEALRLT
jgi:hypothetical protein